MNPKILILSVLMIAVLVSSGCTQSANLNIGCEPDYINAGSDFLQHSLLMSREDACKKACFDGYSVSSYELKEECRCDVNDCGEVIISYCGDDECKDEETCRTCESDCGECPPPIEIKYNEQQASGQFELIEGTFIAKKSKMGTEYAQKAHGIEIPIEFKENVENIEGQVLCFGQKAEVIFACGHNCEEKTIGSMPIGISRGIENGYCDVIPTFFFDLSMVSGFNHTITCSLKITVGEPSYEEIIDLYPILITDDM